MDKARFEELVDKALDGLPDEFAESLDNVAIFVEDYPSREQRLRSPQDEDSVILGLYEGIPLTERGHDYGMVLPDRITIFRKPIESVCRTDDEIVETVRSTVLHEIAHHFGISDGRLDELEGRKTDED
jgi:predicted Zn-dependent protease with MMP-like domain